MRKIIIIEIFHGENTKWPTKYIQMTNSTIEEESERQPISIPVRINYFEMFVFST